MLLNLLSLKAFQDFFGKRFFDLIVARDCFCDSVFRVQPEGMTSPFTLEEAACDTKFSLQIPPLHPTNIFSRMVSSGRPRRKSARRSSNINSIASIRLCFVSSTVSPCPLAPGTSGQTAQKPPSGADSIMAVNSDFTIKI